MRIKKFKIDRWVRKVIKLHYKHISKVKISKGNFDRISMFVQYHIIVLQQDLLFTIIIPISYCNNFYELYGFIISKIQPIQKEVKWHL